MLLGGIPTMGPGIDGVSGDASRENTSSARKGNFSKLLSQF